MCRLYGEKGDNPYIRLCYRTGVKGTRRYITDDQIPGWWKRIGCEAAKTSRSRSTVVHSITFDVAGAPVETVEDMARYMDAEKYTTDPQNGHVTFFCKRGISPNAFVRAASFHWQAV